MTEETKVSENVNEFIDQASKVYGRYKEEEFNQFMFDMCYRKIASPIEQMFFVALHVVAEVNLTAVGVCGEFNNDSDDLEVIPQWKFKNYSIDFALRQHPVDRIVCVELDGHAFHDKDEPQRRYEKRRDRHLTVAGHTVLHYTGAEVVKDPYAVALEAFVLTTGLGHVAIHPTKDA